jgi:4-amino-4-deoxy-L-arabinose transferase-like glycosyltransferase
MISAKRTHKLEQYWIWIYAITTGLLGLWLLHHHYQIISATFPLDYYEGTTVMITGLMAAGNNPYTFEFQPQAMYVYPPLYNMLVAPMTWWLDNSLQLHRLVSAVFILASCLICASAVHRCGQSLRHSMAAAVLLYAALLFYGTPVASTNALGVCLYLLILYLPWRYDFSTVSLAWACVLAVLVFYTKQYFIVAMALLCLYMFLYVSRKRALTLGICYACLLLASLWWVDYTSPYYLDNTFFSPMIAADRLQNSTIAIMQFKEFLRLYWPLLLISGLCARTLVGKPTFHHAYTRFFWFCLLCAGVVMAFSLARNPGNYMTYLFQLLTPSLLIGTFGLLSRQQFDIKALAPLVLICFYQAYALLPKDFSTTEENWQRVDQLISENEQMLTSQMLVATLLKHGKAVEQDGHTFYFPLAADKAAIFIKHDPEQRVDTIWRNYISSIYRKIEAQQYDLIMVTSWDFRGIFVNNPPPFSDLDGKTFLKKYYAVDETLSLSMTERHGGGTWPVRIWRPRQPDTNTAR